MTDATHPGYLVTIGDDEYPVRLPEVTARQVGVIRLLHGRTPTDLAVMVDQGTADLPEVVALAHLSRLQAGDGDFDAAALLDSVTLSAAVVIDRLPAEADVPIEDADPQL